MDENNINIENNDELSTGANENIETLEPQNDTFETINKKGVANKIVNCGKSFISKGASAVKRGASAVKNFTENKIENYKQKQEEIKDYENGTREFFVFDRNNEPNIPFRAIINIENKTIYVSCTEKNLCILKSGIKVKCHDSSIIKISQISSSTEKCLIGNKDHDCIKLVYRMDDEIPILKQTTVNNNTNVNIGGDNNGDITITNYIAELDRIEEELKNAKVIFGGKKQEAMMLFGNFKNCIINKQKDERLFGKFLKLLNTIAPAAATIAATLIQTL